MKVTPYGDPVSITLEGESVTVPTGETWFVQLVSRYSEEVQINDQDVCSGSGDHDMFGANLVLPEDTEIWSEGFGRGSHIGGYSVNQDNEAFLHTSDVTVPSGEVWETMFLVPSYDEIAINDVDVLQNSGGIDTHFTVTLVGGDTIGFIDNGGVACGWKVD